MREVKGTLGGVTYDASSILYKVVVTDNGVGQIITGVTAPSDVTFKNSYKATDASAVLEGLKNLAGRDLKDGEFTFGLYRSDQDGKVEEGAQALQTTTNKNGKFSFTLNYKDGEEGTYYYVVREVKGTLGGVTYDAKSILYKVVVTDNVVGQIITGVTAPSDVTFKNTYKASGKWILKLKKELVGRLLKDQEFRFILMDQEGQKLQETFNVKDGSILFQAIEYSEEDAGKTYTYRVIEEKGTEKGMTYDASTIEIKVSIVDKQDGQLSIQATSSKELKFSNQYTIPAHGTVTAEKTWVNGPKVKPTIWFQLLRALPNGQPIPVPGAPIQKLESGTTKVTWNNLEEIDINGTAYTFSVQEVDEKGRDFAPANFEKTEKGLTVTNRFLVGSTVVAGKKVWVGGPMLKPDITILLKADGIEVQRKVLTNGTTSFRFDSLPIYHENGQKIVYTVDELSVDGYQKTIEGTTITNTIEPAKTRDITVKKVWVKADKKKPAITIHLLANGVSVQKIVLKNGEEHHVFKNLPIFDANGKEITYSVDEDLVKGYRKGIKGFTITNTKEELPWTGSVPSALPLLGVMLIAGGLLLQRKRK
ncbi:hypothetical protein ABB02_00102 [Clostridiaceae bacterium JG1575]|nr:hypothetical protein ABB02_00102 [Clostridiaceae bacterium JG1575]